MAYFGLENDTSSELWIRFIKGGGGGGGGQIGHFGPKNDTWLNLRIHF